MLEKAVEILVAAVVVVAGLAAAAIIMGADSALISSLTSGAVDIIVSVGVIAIVGATVYEIATSAGR